MILAILADRASWLESIKIYNAVILVFLSLSGVGYLQANVHKYENGVASSVWGSLNWLELGLNLKMVAY